MRRLGGYLHIHRRFVVLRSVLWFEYVRCSGCGKQGWRVRAAGEGDT